MFNDGNKLIVSNMHGFITHRSVSTEEYYKMCTVVQFRNIF